MRTQYWYEPENPVVTNIIPPFIKDLCVQPRWGGPVMRVIDLGFNKQKLLCFWCENDPKDSISSLVQTSWIKRTRLRVVRHHIMPHIACNLPIGKGKVVAIYDRK